MNIHELQNTATAADLTDDNYFVIDGVGGSKKVPANIVKLQKINPATDTQAEIWSKISNSSGDIVATIPSVGTTVEVEIYQLAHTKIENNVYTARFETTSGGLIKVATCVLNDVSASTLGAWTYETVTLTDVAKTRIKDLTQTATDADLKAGNYLALDGAEGTKRLPAEAVTKVSDVGIFTTTRYAGKYLAGNGSIATNSGLSSDITNKIYCQPGDVFEYVGHGVDIAKSAVFFNGGSVVSSVAQDNGSITIPSGVDGVVFASVWSAVGVIIPLEIRKNGSIYFEVSALKKDVSKLNDEIFEFRVDREVGYFLDSNGGLTARSNFTSEVTEKIMCSPGDVFEYVGHGVDVAKSAVFFNGYSVVSSVAQDNGSITIPSGVDGVVFGSFWVTGQPENNLSVTKKGTINERIRTAEEEINAIKIGNEPIASTYYAGKYLDPSGTIKTASHLNSDITDLIVCKPGDKYDYAGNGGNYVASATFYNGSTFVGFVGQSDGVITIPSGVNKVRFASYWSATGASKRLVVIKHVDEFSFVDVSYGEIIAPDDIFVAVGRECNLWWSSIANVEEGDSTIYFETICDIGNNLERGFRILPTSSNIGSHSLKIVSRDYKTRRVLSTKDVVVHVVSNAASSANKSILMIGDSRTWQSYGGTNGTDEILSNKAGNKTISTELLSLCENKLDMVGEFVSAVDSRVKNLAQSGATAAWALGKIGDSIKSYCEANGLAAGSNLDLVTIMYGVNDLIDWNSNVIGQYDKSVSKIPTIVDNLKSLVNKVKADYPSCKILMVIEPTTCATQDGFGNWGSQTYRQSQNEIELAMKVLRKEVIAEFSKDEYTNVIIVGAGFWCDRLYGFPYIGNEPTSSRCAKAIEKFVECVHPHDDGYKQIADGIFSAVKYIEGA